MRRLIGTLAVLISINFSLFAQDLEQSRIYEIRSNIAAVPSDVLGNRIEGTNYFLVPPFRSRFALIRVKSDSVVVRFLTWTASTKASDSLRKTFNDTLLVYKRTNGSDSAVRVQRYFLITKGDLDSNSVKVYPRGIKSSVFTLGLVTMPLKLRLGDNFDFQGNLSLGTTAGAKFRISKYNANYLNLLFGASISTVTLDSFSTSGKVTGQPLNNIAVFSPSLGVVFEFGKAQAGIFYGWDFLNKSTQAKYGWIYDRKPWVSLGFGFSIFSVNSQSNNQTQDQTKFEIK